MGKTVTWPPVPFAPLMPGALVAKPSVLADLDVLMKDMRKLDRQTLDPVMRKVVRNIIRTIHRLKANAKKAQSITI